MVLAIFLHYLNREIYRAANVEYVRRTIFYWTRILALGNTEPLFSNFSNILEGEYLTAGADPLFKALINHSQLFIAGERPSIGEFIESRAAMYSFDAARYPMYFSKADQPTIDVNPSRLRQTSATEHLHDEITSMAKHERSPQEVGVNRFDAPVIAKAVSRLFGIVESRGAKAITRSLFAGRLNGGDEELASARLISTVYIRKYLEDLNCTIATGIPSLLAFDHLAQYEPSRDVTLLRMMIHAGGLGSSLSGQDDENLAQLRLSTEQQAFQEVIAIVLATSASYVAMSNGDLKQFVRSTFLPIGQVVPGPLRADSLLEGIRSLSNAVGEIRSKNREFARAYETHMNMKGDKPLILLVTATKVETVALNEEISRIANVEPTYLHHDAYLAVDFGSLDYVRIVHVQCEPGSLGSAGALAVIGDAIRDYSPKAIIVGGIAFGTNSEKQKMGDILVSKFVVEYERVKVKDDETFHRGQKVEASPKLLNLFRAADAAGHAPRVQFGALLTGEKLIDSGALLRRLLESEPEAIGGEMEASGLVAAAQRSRTDWIVVKAIVDWAQGKAAHSGDEHQLKSARKAFGFILAALNKMGF